MISSLIVLAVIAIGNSAFAQQANFKATTATTGCLPLTVKFEDESTLAGISSRVWNFGNGNISDQNDPTPSAIYTAAGTYTVTLTVSNGSQTTPPARKTGFIVVHDFPEVDFSLGPNSGCAPLGIKFTDKTNDASGTLTNWLWVFGDGGTSTVASPSYTYVHPGNVTVSLKVKNTHGCEQTKAILSAIDVLGPTASFSPSSTVSCVLPASIQFTDQSTGTGSLTYSWNFGDGFTSSEVSPGHSFTQAGSYAVVQKVRDTNGCEDSKSLIINAGTEGGMDFKPSLTKFCLGDELTFAVQANSNITTYEWDFGNQTFSTDSDPTVIYPALGTYQVTLKAKLQNNTCFSIVSKTVEVVSAPRTAYTYSIDCNYSVTFTNTTVGFEKLEWYIGGVLQSTKNSFTYPFGFPGEYTVKLISFNSTKCSEELERKITLATGIVASFLPDLEQDCSMLSLSGCAPFSLQFTNKSISPTSFTSVWDFGDGNTSTENDPIHVFGKGNFTVRLTVKNDQGCTSFISAKVSVSDTKPVSKFTIDKTSACAGEIVTFTSQSENTTFWCWDFGDGSTGNQPLTTHKYIRPGIYTVKLISKNLGCSDLFTIVDAIEIKDPFVSFGIGKNCDTPFTIALSNFSDKYDSLHWNFGDGKTSDVDVTSHTYQAIGHYNVELTASSKITHCITKVITPVFIQDIKADFEIDNPTPCKNAPVNFTDKSTSAAGWLWSLGNNFSTLTQNATAAYANAGNYQVMLMVTDTDGCSDQKVLPVKVSDLEGKFDFQASSNCEDFIVRFRDQSIANPVITAWSWDFGDGETSSEANPKHTYAIPGKYPVILSLTNTQGTCSYLKNDAITFTLPVPDFSVSKPSFCIDETIQLINQSSRAISFEWDLGNGLRSTDLSPKVAYSSVGDYPITLNVTDKYGCTLSLTKEAFISIAKPIAAFDVAEHAGACPPFTSFFQNKSTGTIKSWQWDFGDGHHSVLPDPANTYLQAGNFDVKLMVTDDRGCTDEMLTPDFIKVGGPSGNFTSDITGSFCTNKTISFTAQTINTSIHQWDFGDGLVQDLPGMMASHEYNQKGKFTIGLIMIDANGCKVAANEKVTITINDTTRIELPPFPSCIFGSDIFQWRAQSENKDDLSWNWQVDGVTLSTTDVLETTIENGGGHELTLTATNRFGCTSHLSDSFNIQDYLNFIPNVITPNKSGYNESFEVEGIKNGEWYFNVYNRWGNLVYKESNYQGGWDGDDLDPGVYYYSIQNALCEDKKYKGPLAIIR